MGGYTPSFTEKIKNKIVVLVVILQLQIDFGLLPFKFAIIGYDFSHFLLSGGNFPTFIVKSRKNRLYYLFFRFRRCMFAVS